MDTTKLDAKGQRMLELLAEGASSRQVAKKLGLTEGTVRVYLHQLYKLIGVKNRTQAVIWQLAGQQRQEPQPVLLLPLDEGFADVALREDLLSALGIMESFIGPYSRMWDAGIRLNGESIEPGTLELRARVRLLWRALLRGDFAFGKRLYDEASAHRAGEADMESLLLTTLLLLGGYTHAADSVMGPLLRKRKGEPQLSQREVTFLRSLRDYVHTGRDEALAPLQSASEGARAAAIKQLANAALFHASRAHKHEARASAAAEVIWAEAEEARRELEAMGMRALRGPPTHGAPQPSRVGAQREKAATTR